MRKVNEYAILSISVCKARLCSKFNLKHIVINFMKTEYFTKIDIFTQK